MVIIIGNFIKELYLINIVLVTYTFAAIQYFDVWKSRSTKGFDELIAQLHLSAIALARIGGLTVLNMVVGLILAPPTTFTNNFNALLVFLLLPMPLLVLINNKNNDYQKVTEMLFQELDSDEIGQIFLSIERILKISDRYSDEYVKARENIQSTMKTILLSKKPSIIDYFDKDGIKLSYISFAYRIYKIYKNKFPIEEVMGEQ